MTIQEFLKVTAAIPAPVLRRAMAGALRQEPARNATAYPRFYDRVLEELKRTPAGDCNGPSTEQPEMAA